MIIPVCETAADSGEIVYLLDLCFGEERARVAVCGLRQGPSIPDLSMVIRLASGELVASIRYWPVITGDASRETALLLGPLVVHPDHQGEGLGRSLVRHTLARARKVGWSLCLVSGDPNYYPAFGFRPATPLGFHIPGQVDPGRVQALALNDDGNQVLETRQFRQLQSWRCHRQGTCVTNGLIAA